MVEMLGNDTLLIYTVRVDVHPLTYTSCRGGGGLIVGRGG